MGQRNTRNKNKVKDTKTIVVSALEIVQQEKVPEGYLTIAELARKTGISRNTISDRLAKARAKGTVDALYLNGTWVYKV